MCILFLAINQHPDYPLIICANRDEAHHRPTQSAHFWPDHPEILAGRDLEAGGSWLGINKKGDFAAITNVRTGNKTADGLKSRGELVTKFLDPSLTISNDWLEYHCDEYNPFNLIYGNLNELYCFNSIDKKHTLLDDGFHAISNGSMDDIWPKMAKGEKQLEALVQSDEELNTEKLFKILKDQTPAEDKNLPDTGISIEWEKLLSSIFINSTKYGTRSSSLVMQSSDGQMNFFETEYDQKGAVSSENSFIVKLEC